ncbi:MAG: quinoprotein relay system zinc metallohydrolase 1 [Leptothrix sp. (in: b-proteobacteria)]
MPLASAAAPADADTASRVDLARFDLGLRARAIGAPGSGVYVVEGANADFSAANGCNIINTGFIVTDAGVLVINTGTSRRQGEQLRALIGRTTTQPVVQVLHLNLHPDYFLGNQAFADVPRRATATTRAGMAREAAAYETNLYRLCSDWMSGTEALLPDASADIDPAAGALTLGTRRFELLGLSGHTDSDLVLIDRAAGVAFVGGLVFAQRIPTTPHARLADWQRSLDALASRLQADGVHTLVPSHGPVGVGEAGLEQTRHYLAWLDRTFTRWAAEGRDMAEVANTPLPAPFNGWAATQTEYLRNVAHLYPAYERRALEGARPAPR